MAAEIVGRRHPGDSGPSSPIRSPPASTSSNSNRKPELVNKLEGGSDEINGIILLSGENGLISVSNDRSVRIWLLRDNGQYWPSICHYMSAAATSAEFHTSSMKLFIGLENGIVSEFSVAEDYNRMDHVRDYHAHQARVTQIKYSHITYYLCTVSRDKYFQFHDTTNGRRLGGYQCSGWCTALEYDERDKYVFIGDMTGTITVVKIVADGSSTSVQFVNTLKGHSGSIQAIKWNSQRGWLFSGSYDSSVFIWDVGGRKGTVFELQGHRNKVTSLVYSQSTDLLFSSGEDMSCVLWKLNTKRLETSDWSESDNCQLCNRPFYWNFRAMYDQKQIGLRQHHCRKCGKAICDSCSTKRCQLPSRGYEFMVRVCEECYIGVTDEEKQSHAEFFELKQNVLCMDWDDKKKILATAGKDRIIKIWSFKELFD